MPLVEEIPQCIQETLARINENGQAEPQLAVACDIAEDGSFGERWLVQSDHRLLVMVPNGKEAEIVQEVPLSRVTAAKAETLVGNGVLELIIDGHPVQVLRFSNAEIGKFNQVARQIEFAIAKEGAKPPLDTEDRRKRCKNCNRLLPDWSEVCPACVDKGRVMRRLMGYLAPYKFRAILLAVMMLGGTALDLAPPTFTKILIDNVLTKPQTAERINAGHRLPALAKTPAEASPLRLRIGGWTYFDSTKHSKFAMLAFLVLGLVITRILRTGIGMWQGVWSSWLGGKLTLDIRTQLYQRLQYLPLSYYDKRQTGAVMARVTQDTGAVQQFLVDGAQYFLVNVLLLIGIGFMLFAYNWKLALLVMIPSPLVMLMTVFFWKRIRKIFHRYWHMWSRLGAALADSLAGMRVVKAFAQEPREVHRFTSRTEELFAATFRVERTYSLFFPTLTFVTTLGTFLVWYVGGRQVISGEMKLGVLMAYLGYIGMFYGPLQVITRISDWLSRSMTAAERVFEVLDTEPEVPEDPGSQPMPNIEGSVTLKNVRFGYDKNKVVIDGVDIDVKAGEMVGLVGPSGAGKTTLINLICRFYDVSEGEILIDGVDVRKIKLRDLRQQIGVVLQEPFLFSGTISENIAYAKPGATKEEVMAAAKAANAHDFIMKFPDGYDTQVGERGQGLSGGERQRISIARAILHNPRILILDEATSSVDTETEKQIQEALIRLVKNRTTFAIAHRLSTLRNADKLLVMEEGKLKEWGTHNELLEKQGVYHRLVQMQTELSKLRADAAAV